MMFIDFNDETQETWHEGEKFSFNMAQVNRVAGIQADGHELRLIKANFSNLPTFNGPVVMWVGDLAKMIIFNMYNNLGQGMR